MGGHSRPLQAQDPSTGSRELRAEQRPEDDGARETAQLADTGEPVRVCPFQLIYYFCLRWSKNL